VRFVASIQGHLMNLHVIKVEGEEIWDYDPGKGRDVKVGVLSQDGTFWKHVEKAHYFRMLQGYAIQLTTLEQKLKGRCKQIICYGYGVESEPIPFDRWYSCKGGNASNGLPLEFEENHGTQVCYPMQKIEKGLKALL
jgi:hypothetical protein